MSRTNAVYICLPGAPTQVLGAPTPTGLPGAPTDNEQEGGLGGLVSTFYFCCWTAVTFILLVTPV